MVRMIFALTVLSLFLHFWQVNDVQAQSNSEIPDWINNPNQDEGYYWELGFSEGAEKLNDAKNEAIESGKTKLAEFAESRISSSVQILFESVEGKGGNQTQKESRISSSVQILFESVEGKGGNQTQKAVFQDIRINSKAILRRVSVDKTYYRQKESGEYEFYVLVKIPKSELDAEVKRLKEKYFEEIASVDGNLSKGQSLLKQGYLGPALEKFIESAINSTRVPDREHRFDEIIFLIQRTTDRIHYERFNDNQTGTLEAGLPLPVKVKLSYQDEEKTIPIRNTALVFLLKKNPKSRFDRFQITNDKGEAETRIQQFGQTSLKIRMTVKLNLRKALDGFDVLVNEKWKKKKVLIEDTIEQSGTTFYFKVLSTIKQDKSALMVIEKDLEDRIKANSSVENLIIAEFQDRGVANITNQSTKLLKADLNQQIVQLKQNGFVKFYIVEINYSKETYSNHDYIALNGIIKLIDVHSGTVINNASSKTLISEDSNEQQYQNALQKLFKKLVKNLINQIEN